MVAFLKMKVHILDDWFDTLKNLPSFQKLAHHDVTLWHDHCEDIETLTQRLYEAQALVLFRERTKITRALLEKLPSLKLISQKSVYPHIDLDACNDHQVLLCSNMDKNKPSYAAAELTWALILAGMRNLPKEMSSVKNGNWQNGVGKSLNGRTLGLYGYGKIAKIIARYAEAFQMRVIWWASPQGRERLQQDGLLAAPSREAFFTNADVISLHVRLKPSTIGIITIDDFRLMKADALFVNTARAELIKKGALLQALNEGTPKTAAIDVFESEPLHIKNDPLLSHPNLIATPHIGFVTEDELEIQFDTIYDQINAYAEGKPIHMINAQVWQK